jgi:hypothetical protein
MSVDVRIIAYERGTGSKFTWRIISQLKKTWNNLNPSVIWYRDTEKSRASNTKKKSWRPKI